MELKCHKRSSATASEPYRSVSLVEVHGREDGNYVFADEGDAERFAVAVREAGGEASVIEEPLQSGAEALHELIEAERADAQGGRTNLRQMLGAVRAEVAKANQGRGDFRRADELKADLHEAALDLIAALLDRQQWSAETPEAIAAVIRDTGREVRPPSE